MPLIQYPRERIRLKIDVRGGDAVDEITGNSPAAWWGSDLQFELGFFWGQDESDTDLAQPIDLTHFTSITIDGKEASNLHAPSLFVKSVAAGDFYLPLTAEAWASGDTQHLLVPLTNGEMEIDMKGQVTRSLCLIIYGVTNDTPVRRITLGSSTLAVKENGLSFDATVVPIAGGTVIPPASAYDGSGNFVVTTIPGVIYEWTKNANDATAVNGTEILSVNGRFTAQGSSVTLTGTAFLPITAILRRPVFLTADEINAQYRNFAKINNDHGQFTSHLSDNKRYLRVQGVSDDGSRYDQVIDLQA